MTDVTCDSCNFAERRVVDRVDSSMLSTESPAKRKTTDRPTRKLNEKRRKTGLANANERSGAIFINMSAMFTYLVNDGFST